MMTAASDWTIAKCSATCKPMSRARWPEVTTENLREITAFGDFQRDFRQLFGFEVPGVDYEAPVETDVRW